MVWPKTVTSVSCACVAAGMTRRKGSIPAPAAEARNARRLREDMTGLLVIPVAKICGRIRLPVSVMHTKCYDFTQAMQIKNNLKSAEKMRHMETFRLIEAVARAGSIRKAAEDAGLTASALNRRISKFEDEFGAQIFERLSRGVRLNPAGELILQHYRSQRSDMARVQS